MGLKINSVTSESTSPFIYVGENTLFLPIGTNDFQTVATTNGRNGGVLCTAGTDVGCQWRFILPPRFCNKDITIQPVYHHNTNESAVKMLWDCTISTAEIKNRVGRWVEVGGVQWSSKFNSSTNETHDFLAGRVYLGDPHSCTFAYLDNYDLMCLYMQRIGSNALDTCTKNCYLQGVLISIT